MILALAGGVGGAKLAHGLARALPPGELVIAVNTGDDFEHLGLSISPDLDSVMYKLAGLNDPERGWGLADESWAFMAALERLGGETWFNLGDRDLATHVERTRRLKAGETLSDVTAALCGSLGIAHTIAPMSDDRLRTFVETLEGEWLAFQDYFVRLQCEPEVISISFEGAASAAPSPPLWQALCDPRLSAIIICPSNPFVSIAPILALGPVSEFIADRAVPVIAVSPIIGGQAVKGPAAKMMSAMGMPVSAEGIAAHYGDTIDALVIDSVDANLAPAIEIMGPRVLATEILMRSAEDELALASAVLEFADVLAVCQA
ncbi:MAG: 2-phospho-L-lactate transferase [Alphaproteobacteria bacterium]